MFRSDVPLDFSIDVGRGFGPVDANGHPVAGNALFGKTGRLTLRVHDVDDDFSGSGVQREVDMVYLNTYGPELGTLSGADGQWSVNSFQVPLNFLRLPTPSNPTGRNDFKVLIDVANTSYVWGVEVDWAELRVSNDALPVAMIHGFNGSGASDFDTPTGLRRYYYQNSAAGLTPDRIIIPNVTKKDSIEANEQLMRAPVATLLQTSGAEQLNLVTHSMGGLDSRLYAWDHPGQVNEIVMLGTPNGGSRLADIACGCSMGHCDRSCVSTLANATIPRTVSTNCSSPTFKRRSTRRCLTGVGPPTARSPVPIPRTGAS